MKKIQFIVLSLLVELVSQSAIAGSGGSEIPAEKLKKFLQYSTVVCKVGRWSIEGFGENYTPELSLNKFSEPYKKNLKNSENIFEEIYVSSASHIVKFSDQNGMPDIEFSIEYKVAVSGENFDELKKGIVIGTINKGPQAYNYNSMEAGTITRPRLLSDKFSVRTTHNKLVYYATCNEFVNQDY
jgi:hypothetical protein